MAYAIVASKPGGTDVLRKIDIALPVPAATDVLIRQTVACFANHLVEAFREKG